jgi:Zn-dependent protease/predicted transcriptional regulator
MNGNIRVGSLFGIPFFVNLSWFVVLGLVTLTYGNGLAVEFPALAGSGSWLLGLVTALLLFASVLAHELGHSFVALRQGIGVKSITLFLFGGLASLEKESQTPAAAFWVAIAGPLVSIALACLLFVIGTFSGASGPIAAILGVLTSVNLALALFNLIPGLPLDGGNVLKALIWKITGNRYQGSVVAGRGGQIMGWVAILSGLLPLILLGRSVSLWNLLIGWFLLQNASQAVQSAIVQNQLSKLTASDAVLAQGPIVSNQLSLREFADRQILSQKTWQKFLVTNPEGRLVGTVAVSDLNTIPVDRWSDTSIQDLIQPIEPSDLVQSDRSLLDVFNLLLEKQVPALPVIQENGILVGLLEKTAILRLITVDKRVPA